MKVRMKGDVDLQLRIDTKKNRWALSVRSGDSFRLNDGRRPKVMSRYGWSFWKGRHSGVVIAPGIDICCSIYRGGSYEPKPTVMIDVETLGVE